MLGARSAELKRDVLQTGFDRDDTGAPARAPAPLRALQNPRLGPPMHNRITPRTLLHIGGGPLHLPALRWAHEAGFDVVVTDADQRAPGRACADAFFAIADGSVDELVELARRLNAERGLCAVYAAEPIAASAAAVIGEDLGLLTHSSAAVRRALEPLESRATLHAQGLLVSDGRYAGDPREVERFEVNAFFRDGAFIPGGLLSLTRTSDGVRELALSASHCEPAIIDSIYRTMERAARALELTGGPVGAEIVLSSNGPMIVSLTPCFQSGITTEHALPLALDKSPVQAWFATLTSAGAPFDAMPNENAPLQGAPAAGWIALRAALAGRLEAVTGLDRARAATGVEGARLVARIGDDLADPRDERSLVGYVWASGWDASEVERSLRDARASISVEIQERSVA